MRSCRSETLEEPDERVSIEVGYPAYLGWGVSDLGPIHIQMVSLIILNVLFTDATLIRIKEVSNRNRYRVRYRTRTRSLDHVSVQRSLVLLYEDCPITVLNSVL